MIWWRRRPTEAPATPAEALDEQLSAYIDGDLSEAEAAAVEARLAVEPQVRDALSGMQQVRDMLVELGETAAPRAFTLEAPPARAGLPRMELFARLGAAVSALALAAVLVGDAVTTADLVVQPASISQPATLQAAAPAAAPAAPATAAAAPEERATSEGQATAEAQRLESAESALPAPAPATTDAADATETTQAAPAAAPSTAQATDERQAPGTATADEPPPTVEQAGAVDLAPPRAADPGGAALDAARVALLALVALFAAAAVWQFARRPR